MGIIPFSQPAVQKEFFFNKTHIPGDGSLFGLLSSKKTPDPNAPKISP
jgi:hypothetical protein